MPINAGVGSATALCWVEANQNRYGVRVLDCRPVTQTMLSVTSDPNIAQSFASLRTSNGEQHRGKVPENASRIVCDLRYPCSRALREGPLFVAAQMEDKWDIYHFEGHLYFARSWQGKLIFRVKAELNKEQLHLTWVEADLKGVDGDAALAVREVDFLVKSHLYRRETPHPLPTNFPAVADKIAAYSMSQFGRWASFATYEDTTKIRL